ncbi:MAG: protein adenylyltransferase SelO family protein [Sphingomonadaceae bacterium]
MALPPRPSRYRPQPAILELGEAFYDRVEAADFPQAIPRFRNDRWAGAVGLQKLSDEQWTAHFACFEPLPENLEMPLALKYHGHQFRIYNPDIGDGRGFLFAQLADGHDRLLDLGTKGSGQTPYSRFGDGRLTLKGGVRELLATEMLEALRVDTSKTFSLIETGEALERGDEPSPTRSAAMVRLSHGHIRIGTFQRLAYFEQTEEMERLVAYCHRHFFEGEGAEGPAALLDQASRRTATLAASYMAAGFVHGVLNSDNINITGESFDYGPWRFTPYWDPAFTAAYFDHAGLYSFGRQPEAIQWDLVQLAVALRALAEAEELMPALRAWPERFDRALQAALLARLGVVPRGEEKDRTMLRTFERALAARTAELDRVFFDWRGGARRGSSPAEQAYEGEAFAAFGEAIAAYEAAPGALDHEYWADDAPCSMHIDELEAIWARIDEADDWGPLEDKIAAIRRMGAAHRPLDRVE